MARVSTAQRSHVEGFDLRPDRCPAGGADHVAARDDWRESKLGLSLHLGKRRGLYPSIAARLQLGFDTEADDFLAFLGDVLEPQGGIMAGKRLRANLQVLYPVDDASTPSESELDHLTGYGGSRPVRVGNAAYNQVQFDILGAIVDCIFEHTRSRDSLSERSWRIVVQAVEMALKLWREPDRGIWEVRGEPQHFTFSKVMCWVAADRGARLAALRGERDRADAWWAAAQEIHEEVCAKAYGRCDRGRFRQYYGSGEMDASLLLLPLVRDFLPPDRRAHPRHGARHCR